MVVEVVEVVPGRRPWTGAPSRERDHADLSDLRSQLAMPGGGLEAGPVEGGGYRIRARIPVRYL